MSAVFTEGHMEREHNVGDTAGAFFLGLVLGVIGGAAAGVLYAPRPGRETRADLAVRARGGKEKLTTAAEKGMEMFREGRHVFSRGGQAIASALHEGRAAYERARTNEGS